MSISIINPGVSGITVESDPTAVKKVGDTMSGILYLPTVRNLLNADLNIVSYNDTGAGTTYTHSFKPYDGTFQLAPNGGGIVTPSIKFELDTQTDNGSESELNKVSLKLIWDSTWNTTAPVVLRQEAILEGNELRIRKQTYVSNPLDPGNFSQTEDIGLNLDPYLGLTFRTAGNQFMPNTMRYEPTGIRWTDGVLQTARGLPLSGGTLTGKLNCAANGFNVGINGSDISSNTAGDMWIATGGVSLNYRDANGAWRILPALNNANTFSSNQVIAAATTGALLRITQTGTGNALVVEDTNNPDTTSFVIDTNGNVGVGVATNFTPTVKLEVAGSIKAATITNGSGPDYAVNSVTSYVAGTPTHQIAVSIGGSTYRIPAIFVSTN